MLIVLYRGVLENIARLEIEIFQIGKKFEIYVRRGGFTISSLSIFQDAFTRRGPYELSNEMMWEIIK